MTPIDLPERDPRAEMTDRLAEVSQRLGATVLDEAGVYFRVWAPKANEVEVELAGPDGPYLPPFGGRG